MNNYLSLEYHRIVKQSDAVGERTFVDHILTCVHLYKINWRGGG